MAKGEYILNVGDDNVVLIRIENKKVINAWLASPDSATALEELGEALAADKKGRISLLVDTLDQAFKEEEVPKVGILDRRKVLSRHINMAFPGANMRGARLVEETKKKTLLYEFAAVPLDGRIPGWVEFYESLPNEKGGVYAIATENGDIAAALAPKDSPVVTEGNLWRHFIGINVTGGLRQIIQKNGRLCLTRLTQAPPPDTPPDEFADMIARDFKATITYLRRLGYAVGDALDLIVITGNESKQSLEKMAWDGTRSVGVMTPVEAAIRLGLGPIGPEEQSHCDILHAAWFSNKRRPILPLTRSAALGTAADDLREISFVSAPYAAAIASVALVAWAGMTASEYLDASEERDSLNSRLEVIKQSLSVEQGKAKGVKYDAGAMRNAFGVEDAMNAGRLDIVPPIQRIFESLQSDAVVLRIIVSSPASRQPQQRGGGQAAGGAMIEVATRLAGVIVKAEEASQVANKLHRRLIDRFGQKYQVRMTREPVTAQASQTFSGGLESTSEASVAARGGQDAFFADFEISEVAGK